MELINIVHVHYIYFYNIKIFYFLLSVIFVHNLSPPLKNMFPYIAAYHPLSLMAVCLEKLWNALFEAQNPLLMNNTIKINYYTKITQKIKNIVFLQLTVLKLCLDFLQSWRFYLKEIVFRTEMRYTFSLSIWP